MPERNSDVFERKFFPARVKTDGHGGADAETNQQVIVRIGSGVAAACAHGFVSNEAVLTGDYFLFETVRLAAHDDIRCVAAGLCSHNWNQGRRIPTNRSR